MSTCHTLFPNYLIIKSLLRVIKYMSDSESFHKKLHGLINQSFTIVLLYLIKTGKCVKGYYLFCFFI